MYSLPTAAVGQVRFVVLCFRAECARYPLVERAAMTMRFTAQPIWWQGPAPFLFIPVPEEQSRVIKDGSKAITYGWGCIPVRVWIGKSCWTTSLIPKNGVYLLPIKKAISQVETISLGGTYAVAMELGT